MSKPSSTNGLRLFLGFQSVRQEKGKDTRDPKERSVLLYLYGRDVSTDPNQGGKGKREKPAGWERKKEKKEMIFFFLAFSPNDFTE